MKKNRRLIIFAVLALAAFVVVLNLAGARKISALNSGNQINRSSSTEGASDSTEVIAKKSGEGSLIWSLVRLVGALVLVVGGIYGFLYLLRKMMGSRLSSNRNHRMIEVLETSYIAQKKSVSLIRFTDRAVLVGVTDNSMTPLAELSSDETMKLLSEIQRDQGGGSFKGILTTAREKYMSINFGGKKTIES